MGATPEQITRLRRMVNEPDETTYNEADIAAYIESNPALDDNGNGPSDEDWTETYDLHAAAADIWEEKAAATSELFDFQADGGSFTRSQKHQQHMQQARYHRSRRRAGSIKLVMSPRLELESE